MIYQLSSFMSIYEKWLYVFQDYSMIGNITFILKSFPKDSESH